ncbi:MAG: YdcF family protein [Methylotenera sp.]|nr:YdcF family protein [Oligoflexia bacterium]
MSEELDPLTLPESRRHPVLSLRTWAAILFFVLGVTLGAWVLTFVSAGDVYEYQDSVDGVHLPQVDAIVCLAGGRGRIAAAGDLWYRYWEHAQGPAFEEYGDLPPKTPILYISGMGKGSTWNVLAKQVRRGVLEDLKPKDVILETESTNTEENAEYLMKYAKERGWKKILLMTSRYHMRRSQIIFGKNIEKAALPLQVETLSVYQEPFEPGEWRGTFHGIRVTMLEYLKWLYYKAFWGPKKG